MTTHYHSSSRGPVEIATMHHSHAVNALAKLEREDPDGERSAERDALRAHIDRLEAEQADG
jgi:hypothetical protein